MGAEPVESVLRRAAGRDWHERELARELRAERGGTAGWILAVLGLTLVALAVLASGIVP